MFQIEALLSARLFLSPQRSGEHLYFMSNLSGQFNLYRMRWGGSVPEPLVPLHLHLPSPEIVNGAAYHVLPKLGKILVMIDNDGDENYQPFFIPMDGGIPQPAFEGLEQQRMACFYVDEERNLGLMHGESRQDATNTAYLADFASGSLTPLMQSQYGAYPISMNQDGSLLVLGDFYTVGDTVLYLLRQDGTREVLYGVPMEERSEGQDVPLNGLGSAWFVNDDRGLLVSTSLFEDSYSVAYLDLSRPQELRPVPIQGLRHEGAGELEFIGHLVDNRFEVKYNIDGASWLYEAEFDGEKLNLLRVIVGEAPLDHGVLQSVYFHKPDHSFVFSFSSAVSPSQIYSLSSEGDIVAHTQERFLGVPADYLSAGEDYAFNSHDGLRISARLYLPAPALGYEGRRPLVYYIHGGPQSQEKPDFTWFSMPLIQFLTLNGFAVFVPNVRGSSGYGMDYMKQVDRDWGGQDRLDHVHAMTKVLPQDERIDSSRAAVVGRSYGGYMTLTLAGRHPELWQAAVDMFGPYDLLTFMERIPPTWKPYFHMAVGHPEKDHDLLVERSPKTYMQQLACPMLVIQGANDPRVVLQESQDVVSQLQAQGKSVELLVFPDEGHDITRFENRVTCYNAITDFFRQHLGH